MPASRPPRVKRSHEPGHPPERQTSHVGGVNGRRAASSLRTRRRAVSARLTRRRARRRPPEVPVDELADARPVFVAISHPDLTAARQRREQREVTVEHAGRSPGVEHLELLEQSERHEVLEVTAIAEPQETQTDECLDVLQRRQRPAALQLKPPERAQSADVSNLAKRSGEDYPQAGRAQRDRRARTAIPDTALP